MTNEAVKAINQQDELLPSSKAREAIHEAAELIANCYCDEEDTFFFEQERLIKAIVEIVDRPLPAPQGDAASTEPPKVNSRANVEWLNTNEELYAGKWVALRNGELLASSESLDKLRSVVGETKGTGILLTLVSAQGDAASVVNKITSSQKPLDPAIAAALNEDFGELYETASPLPAECICHKEGSHLCHCGSYHHSDCTVHANYHGQQGTEVPAEPCLLGCPQVELIPWQMTWRCPECRCQNVFPAACANWLIKCGTCKTEVHLQRAPSVQAQQAADRIAVLLHRHIKDIRIVPSTKDIAAIIEAELTSTVDDDLGVTPEVAGKLLLVRKAIAKRDLDDAWHHLYSIASPGFDEFEPWKQLEAIAATNQAKQRPAPGAGGE